MPADLGQMPVAWQQLRIPGPPPGLALSLAEQTAQTPETRFARRSIQRLELRGETALDSGCSAPSRSALTEPTQLTQPIEPTQPTDQLALIDKASPHALFDLMLTEVSPRGEGQAPKADAGSVMPITGQLLWQTAANFHRFVSRPEIRREFGLGAEADSRLEAGSAPMAQLGMNQPDMKQFNTKQVDTEHVGMKQIDAEQLGMEQVASSGVATTETASTEVATQSSWLQLALNCDPNTHDRESVQALKSFHLHLIYWRPSELQTLSQADRYGDQNDPYLARQCLDPLSFIGPRLLDDRLQALDPDLAALGAHRLPADASSTCAGQRPMGCLIALPSWGLLATPAFEQLIRQLHGRLAATASALLRAFTGAEQAPMPWQRHRLLPLRQISQNLESIGLSAATRADLLALAQQLLDLPAPLAQHLQRASPARRMHQMTLNQPCYSLSLSPMDALGRSTLGADGPLLLSLQLKLFSGIGGAGLFSFPGIPSVRVLRAQGRFSDADWQRRAEFQRRFAEYNSTIMRQACTEGRLRCGPVGQFQSATGWTR
ncbi:hypothetical protein U5801_02530 [Lamprobacter modestohalophilus]|uniref:hypothetical protein n=1 Tax=Lamprobacter modestohalophilus TaxID=1064514 RepID=UPI002ADED2E2|nr:hypothetical protein [Lamprobacter modestohalophilus]MEA1048701.1 hypothetical protein [Lamprobacter modestohalophilus]